jgi:hypothetical protein
MVHKGRILTLFWFMFSRALPARKTESAAWTGLPKVGLSGVVCRTDGIRTGSVVVFYE